MRWNRRLMLAGVVTAAAGLLVVGAAGLSGGDPVATADVCVHKESGHVRLQEDAQSCLAQELAFHWTVGGEVTEVVGGDGVTAERRGDSVLLGYDDAVVQAKVAQACGDGTDGSAIAAIDGAGSVACTFPHGIVATLNAGTIAAAGSTSFEPCHAVERAGMVPNVQQSTSLEIELPPGTYRALPGYGMEFTGAPLTWRINKSARRDDVFAHYQGTVRAVVQNRDPSASSWRRATQHLRHRASTGSGGHPDITHELNREDEDLGIFQFGFTQKVRLLIQVVATPCTWSQIGGQVAIERIG